MNVTRPLSVAAWRATTIVLALTVVSVGDTSAGAAPLVPVIRAPVIIDAAASGALSLAAVSCVSAGNCTAVGRLANTATSTYVPVAVSETSGTWGSPVPITLPAGAFANGSLNGLTSVHCFSPGNCEAVGRFSNGPSDTTTPMATTETGGVWSSASSVGQPVNGSSGISAWLTSLSCPSEGNCSAVGTYFNSQIQVEPMVATEVNGTWSVPNELLMASGYTPVQGIWSISCVGTTCTAVGPIASGANDLAGVATESGGTWSSAAPVSTASGTTIYGLSCTTSGCVAVGDESTSNSTTPALFTETGGNWVMRNVSAAPASSTDAFLLAVNCTSWGNCNVAGDDSTGTGAFALAEEDGTWTPSVSIPVNDASASIVEITGLSCTSALDCVAVGGVGTDSNVNAVIWTSNLPAPRTIVCKRGRQVRRVSGVAPHCPSGYRRT